MSIHKEIALEDGICAHLAAQGWLYEANAAARYDRASALFPEDLLAWVEATQPDAWVALQKAHGTAAGATLAQRLRAALDKQGTGDDFYKAKLATARFYFARLLPETAMLIRQARSGVKNLMEMDESLF